MSKILWYVNRLKAMNVREVMWRLDQKRIEKQEQRRFAGTRVNIGDRIFNPAFAELRFDCNALGVNFYDNFSSNINCHELDVNLPLIGSCGWVPSVNTEIHLLKGADYERWPDTFSYKLNYKQRDDLGDARTNWEKNRHFQWSLTAKRIYVLSLNTNYHELSTNYSLFDSAVVELEKEVTEWMEKNPFLHGISWTSAMEFAIRSINWMYALAFVQKAGKDIPQLRNGIINITDYLTKHYSRFSSANNHLLVEATAIGLAGYAFGHKPWQELAARILTEELPKQNYSDGVNKELSLHYQTFGMEAYLLLSHVMQKNNDSRWKQWMPMLQKEAEFVAHSSWREKTVCEFGDDDEGKILDLQGGEWHQWEWVLQLASLVTGVRYSAFENVCENTHWLFTEEEIENIKRQPLYDASKSRCFEIGGNSFLRDKDNRILIGIDHAELGFGSIAAHGHADALSFQMLVDGETVFADPGTYIYHCWIEERDKFRKTINHNTLCLMDNNKSFVNQSKMLGAFMWGDRAHCRLVDYEIGDERDVLIAEHDGYRPCIHRRKFEFDKFKRVLNIEDEVTEHVNYAVTFMLGQNVEPMQMADGGIELRTTTAVIDMHVDGAERIAIEDAELSPEYGVKVASKAIRVYGHCTTITTTITMTLK